jgi:hypothetical protein
LVKWLFLVQKGIAKEMRFPHRRVSLVNCIVTLVAESSTEEPTSVQGELRAKPCLAITQ